MAQFQLDIASFCNKHQKAPAVVAQNPAIFHAVMGLWQQQVENARAESTAMDEADQRRKKWLEQGVEPVAACQWWLEMMEKVAARAARRKAALEEQERQLVAVML